jgi:hypothetical protein
VLTAANVWVNGTDSSPARCGDCQIGHSTVAYALPTVECALRDKGDSSMKPLISAFAVAMATAAGVSMVPSSAGAAELQVPVSVRHHHGTSWCGPCGCLHVSYDYHRELRSTYGLGFDPRNFDQTQPYYFVGPVRAYARYWCDAETLQEP